MEPRAYPLPSSPLATAVMKGNRRAHTKPEMRVRRALHAAGMRFRVDLPIRVDSLTVRPDIVFTRKRLAIFVDGCFWHGCPVHFRLPSTNAPYWQGKIERNMLRDKRVNAALADGGWRVIRLWEHTPVDEAVAAIVDVCAEERSTEEPSTFSRSH